MFSGGQHVGRRAGGEHDAVLQEHQRLAQAGREVEIVRRDDDGDRRAALQVAQQRGDFELIGRDRAPPSARRAAGCRVSRPWLSGSESREICASAAAMMTRCFSPPLSVANSRSSSVARARRRQRVARDRDVARALDLERRQVRIASHQDDFERREVERQVRFLRHDGHPPRHRRARHARADRRRRATPGRSRADACRPAARSSVVLPEPFGPRIPTKPPAGTSSETPRRTGVACAVYENVTSAARSNPQPHHPAASERRVAERFLVVAIEEVRDAAEELQTVPATSTPRPRSRRCSPGASKMPPNVPKLGSTSRTLLRAAAAG